MMAMHGENRRRFGVMVGVGLLLASGLASADQTGTGAPSDDPNPGSGPSCALSGSESVLIQGAGILRLGDVAGCPGVRYEVVPGLFINGQPAVRLLPKEGCAPTGAEAVTIDGAPANRTGDGC